MQTAATYDDLRGACHAHNQAGRHEEALAAADEAWRRFPERRHFTWYLRAYTNLAMDRTEDALAAMELAEAEDALWRIGMLGLPELERLRSEPRFAALRARVEARIAACRFEPRLLVTEPDPPDARAPLLLGLHGAASVADGYHSRWLPAAALRCIVASAQSSQPATRDAFCWDDRDQVRRDLTAVLPRLPAHGHVALTGFSQGAAVALQLALAGDLVPATSVIAVGPSYPPTSRFPEAARPLSVVIVRGVEDPWGSGVPATVEWLRAAGHRVRVDEVPGLGHDYPDDFAERLPGLLAEAGLRAP